MPVGLSFLGAAYDDSRLLQFAGAYEAATRLRVSPPRTPPLDDAVGDDSAGAESASTESASTGPRGFASTRSIELRMEPPRIVDEPDGCRVITVTVGATSPGGSLSVRVFVNGTEADVFQTGDTFTASIQLSASEINPPHSEWVPPYGPMIVVLARDGSGAEAGHLTEVPQGTGNEHRLSG